LSISAIPVGTALPIFANLLSIPMPGPDTEPDIGSERHRAITKKVLIDWVRGLAGADSLLLFFEDEQWADLTSRELLAELIEGLSSVPALVLVSKRSELEAGLGEANGVHQMRLTPLNFRDATTLIRDLSPANPPSTEVVAFVLNRAEGVPLYIEELTQSALEVGVPADPSSPTGRSSDDDIPSSLQSSLLARLDRLGPAKEIAQIAATIGRDFDVELLCQASGLSESAIHAELENLIRSGLIVPKEGGRGADFLFKHALLQQAAESTMLRERRQKLHAQIARAMELRDPEAPSKYPELLAQHFASGGAFDRAADYWLMAGLKAGKTWAKVEAARMFERGIEAARMLPDSPERDRQILRLELERGDVLYAAFGYVTGEGSTAYHRAIEISEELGEPDAPIRALDGLFGTHFNSGQFSEAIGASDRLIALGENHENIKALVLGLQFKGMSLFCRGQLTSARLYLERALTYRGRADEVGSDFPSMAMIYLSWTMHILGDQAAALALFREAESTVRSQSPYRLAACLGNGCILFAFREDTATITQLVEELLPLARENGFNLWTKMGHFFRGWALADNDRSISGTAQMQDTVQSLGDQEVDKSCYLGLLGKAYLRTGQLNLAMDAVRQGLSQSNKIGEHYFTAELLRVRGEIERRIGADPGVAEASFREAIAFAQGQAARSWELRSAESLARLLSSPGTSDEAGEVFRAR
jgi:tetratricopeptide (TPR) repeat protein